MSNEVRIVEDIGILEANVDCGEGSVRLSDRFFNQNSTWELDVLGDWISQLQELYSELHAEVYSPNVELP